jgi:hypothetical protein
MEIFRNSLISGKGEILTLQSKDTWVEARGKVAREQAKSGVLIQHEKRNPSENRGPNLKFLWYFVRYQSTYEQIVPYQSI